MPFTPGPWGLIDAGADGRNKGYIRPLSSTREDGARPAVARVTTTGHKWSEWRANADLVALAPEMAALVGEMACQDPGPQGPQAPPSCGRCTVCRVKKLLAPA